MVVPPLSEVFLDGFPACGFALTARSRKRRMGENCSPVSGIETGFGKEVRTGARENFDRGNSSRRDKNAE
jgi:hypothetical protein